MSTQQHSCPTLAMGCGLPSADSILKNAGYSDYHAVHYSNAVTTVTDLSKPPIEVLVAVLYMQATC